MDGGEEEIAQFYWHDCIMRITAKLKLELSERIKMQMSKIGLSMKYVLVLSTLSLALLQSCQKDPQKMSRAELVRELSEKDKYQGILEYAKSSGVEVGKFGYLANNQAPVFELLEEIAYGHKPALTYLEKKMPADTARIREAAENLISGDPVEKVLEQLEPAYPVFKNLQKHYRRLTGESKLDSAVVVAESLNAYRWIRRQAQHAPRFVLVNIQGAYLTGMDSTGRDVKRMRTVVGKIDTPTPTIDTYATSIVTHPYWNVPKSIAINEIFPKAQKNREYLNKNKIAIIDNKGEAVDPEALDWDELSADKFPYRFRQETGEDNSLGLLKVEIKNPLAIYLHDTNARYLFNASQRWRSHGCVRVQHPTELANYMAGTKLLDSDLMTEPDTVSVPPKWHKLKQRIPVFLFYLGADCDENGTLQFFRDVYKRRESGV
jgi:murein L,D-transpeptidase YcbB/YkuD